MRSERRRNLRFGIAPIVLSAIFCSSSGCAPATDQATISVTGSPTADPAIARDAVVSSIYTLEKRRDIPGLLSIAYPSTAAPPASPIASVTPTAPSTNQTASPQPIGDPAIALALFMLDRTRYRDAFVAAYPHSIDGVNGDYGSRLDRAGLDPRGAQFPILALSGLAISGNADARRALVTALPYATGSIADAYATEAARVFEAAPPADALAELATLPSQIRIAAISEINWCGRRPSRLLAASPQALPSEAERQTANAPSPGPSASSPPPLAEDLVQQQIRQNLTMCDFVAARTRDELRAQRRETAKKHRHAKTKHPKKPKKT